MTRSKVNLAYITDDKARKASYTKRKMGLIKKVRELSTLCGVLACVVICNKFHPMPEAWPSPQEAANIFAMFNALTEEEKSSHMVTDEMLMRQRIKKAQEELICLREEIHRTKMEIFRYYVSASGLNSLDGFDIQNNASHMKSFLDQTRKDITSRIEEPKK